jgi:cytochrome c peroxidase
VKAPAFIAIFAGLVGTVGVPTGPRAGMTETAYTYGVGVFAPEYAPPPPGTYELPPIAQLEDHEVLDSHGQATSLFAMKGRRAAVVGFVYTTCGQPTGCPLSNATLRRIDRLLADDPTLASRVVLITVSFDPERDTPERMARFGALFDPQTDWRFVTTRNQAALRPLLDDFGQRISELRLPDGRGSGIFRHVLKVFLVDGDNRVRNVYSVGFLHPEMVLNDVRTIMGSAD